MTGDTQYSAVEALRHSIDELALETALRDFSSSDQLEAVLPLFHQIRSEAESGGYGEVAAVAAVLPSTAAALQDAVSKMQELLAQAERATAGNASVPAAPVPLNQDPELIADFIVESRDHLEGIEAQLLALEQDPRNTEAINTIFRGFHTIKGLAGFLEFASIQKFAHEVETLLDLARNLKRPVNSTMVDIILQSADYLAQCLRALESGAGQPDAPEPLVAKICRMIETDEVEEATAAARVEAAPAAPAAQTTAAPAQEGPRSVKVDTLKLDHLVEMMGELVIAQSLIQHDPVLTANHSPKLMRNMSQLNRITADVQRIAMAMRMIPVGQLFHRMARLVRDLARKSGKQANLELIGEETELDRNMVEELADPLMHMIRNAVDHGAEDPDTRIAAGKDPVATLQLKAYHKGGFINIEVADDGRGLNRGKIIRKAIEKHLITDGEHLTDQEVFSLIFEPGFSTATQITDVSGRGVGMDVVRKQIAKLRGRIEITSVEGRGTTFVMKLPLTMAIIEGLVVGVGAHRYIMPLFAVKEMFRPAASAVSGVPGGGEMVLVRGGLLPVLRLHRRFGVVPASYDPSASVLIVIETARRSFCVQVDELIGKQEVVIKNLGETFRHVKGVAGGSILGDGRVGLILDVEALVDNQQVE